MSYLTLEQAKNYLGSLWESAYTPNDSDFCEPSDVLLQEDIDAVTALVNSYVKTQYDFEIVALESLALLKGISERLLKAKAYERFDSSSIPEIVVKNADDSIFRLKDISKGTLKLSDSGQAPKANIFAASYGTGDSSSSSNAPLFTRSRMRGI
jgi:hypothetical protein